jgi:branched-chain amino acid aminotransferase
MKLQKTGDIWFDGKLVPWDDAKIHVLSHAMHYASSVFEGLRAYATPSGAAVVRLEEHVERLFRSCNVIDLPLEFTREQVIEGIRQTVRQNGHESCYIRPLAFRGYGELGVDPRGCPAHLIIATWPHGAHFGDEAREKGLSLGISSWRRMSQDTHPAMAKAVGNYINSQLILLEAKRHGYDDGLALDQGGHVAETSGANLFLVEDGRVITPPLDASVLSGITRSCAITLLREMGIELAEHRLAREMLYQADEIFLTGTAAEVTPVQKVDGKVIGSGARGPLTERLQTEYFRIVRGETADRHGWLTMVGSRAAVS